MALAFVAVFVVVVGLVYGLYWWFVLREEDKLIARLGPGADASAKRRSRIVKPDDVDQSAEVIERALERTGPWMLSLRELTEQSGMKVTPVGLLALMVWLGAMGYGVAWFLGAPWFICLGLALLASAIPYWFVAFARNRRILKFEETFPEAIDLIARALRAGHALPAGLQMVADEMPAPIGTEFRILYDEQNFGLTMSDAMRNFARRIPVLDARFFVTAVLTQRESGGNLAEVLDNLSSVIRDRFKVKRQIRVISAHGRITGWVLACLPPSLGMLTMLINPNHLGTLLGSQLGHQLIIGAITLQVIGTLIMRKIVAVEY